jgi:hypothetical protein
LDTVPLYDEPVNLPCPEDCGESVLEPLSEKDAEHARPILDRLQADAEDAADFAGVNCRTMRVCNTLTIELCGAAPEWHRPEPVR